MRMLKARFSRCSCVKLKSDSPRKRLYPPAKETGAEAAGLEDLQMEKRRLAGLDGWVVILL